MILRTAVFTDRYYDSVFLMSLAGSLKKREGVLDASAVMGTEANKALLKESDMLDATARAAEPADLIVSVFAATEEMADAAIDEVENRLEGDDETPAGQEGPQEVAVQTLPQAVQVLPKARIVQISIPGTYVRHEALKALDLDLHPFIFSDNVSVEDEIELKELGRERGLIVMGPDCGTSILNGVALGFANVVPRGPVGIVGASGTGIQELTTLLARAGIGTHQAIGVGGRDLSEAVGGLSMLQGIEVLDEDETVRVIVLVSKPPHPSVARKVLETVKAIETPTLVCFLGGDPELAKEVGVPFTARLDLAALMTEALLDGSDPMTIAAPELNKERLAQVRTLAQEVAKGRTLLRGLYSGGTLCDEAIQIGLEEGLKDVHTNLHDDGDMGLDKPGVSQGNCFLDLGDDYFTRGKPHPMIDFDARVERIAAEAADPQVAVILLDVVLGYGSHPDPAGALDAVIRQVVAEDDPPVVVASVTGTDQDPQPYSSQRQRLEAAGAIVLDNNAQAGRFAAAVVRAIEEAAE